MKATKIMLLITALAMVLGMVGCASTHKTAHSENTRSDSTGKSTTDNLTVTTQTEQADTVVTTDSSSLEGSFDFWGDTSQTIESEDISVVAYPNRVTGKVKLKATAKPKSIPVKVNKQTNTVAQNHTASNVQTHKEVQVKDREKVKSGMAWYWWILIAIVALILFILLVRYWMKRSTFNIFP